MRRFPLPYVLYPLAFTLILAGLFYLPYLSVRNKTIKDFHEQQNLLLDKAVEGLQDFFITDQKALKYLAEQQSIAELQEVGFSLLKNFYTIHDSQLLAIFRTDIEGKELWNTSKDIYTEDVMEALDAPLFLPATQPAMSDVFIFDAMEVAILTQPIFRQEKFLGNISFLIPCECIARQYIEPLKKDPMAEIILFSRNGKTLYPGSTDAQGRAVLVSRNRELLEKHKDILQQQRGFFTLKDDPEYGAERYGIYLKVSLPAQQSWSILMISPENEVLSTMTSFRRQWVLVTLITLFAVGLLSMWLTIMIARKNKELKKRRFENQLVQLLDCAPMGVLMVSVDGLISYANDSVAQLVGVTQIKSMFGEQFAELVHPGDRLKVKEKIRNNSGDTGQEDLIDTRIIHRNGRELDILLSVTPLHFGQEQHRIIIIQDVTDKRKGEEAQQTLATAVEQVRENVLITNTKGHIEYINAAFCAATGYAYEEIIGRSFRLLWSQKNKNNFFRQAYEVIASDSVWQGRVVIKKKDGAVFLAATSISPVKNREGVVTHFVTVQRDVTKEVELESRLRQAQKMEAIGTLAGGIAHDFNNILGAIIGFTDMALLQTKEKTNVYNCLLHIRKGGKRAANLVQQILTFSRQSTLEKNAIIMAPLIKESLHFIRASLPATIEIKSRIVDKESMVNAAPVQLQQVFMNLCTNAFHAMREKGGVLAVALERLPEEKSRECSEDMNGKCLCLTVRDTGSGMKNATLDRIFTPFFTTKKPGEGTGMGLSVVLGIVQDLGGDIQVHSAVGKGTVFKVILPIVESKSSVCPTESVRKSHGNEHILIIDDEQEIRETSKMMLSHFGYKVSTTGNPSKALSFISSPNPQIDLIITDQTMPGITGIELIQKIAKINPKIPIILCTGYSDKVNLELALKAGAVDLMMKPVDLQELSTSVRAALEGTVGYHRAR